MNETATAPMTNDAAPRGGKPGGTRASNLGKAAVAAVLLVVALLAVNTLAGRMRTSRLDLTRSGQYTLSPATRDLLASLKDQVTVSVYATGQGTPPDWTQQRQELTNLLQEYRGLSAGKLKYAVKDPGLDKKIEEEADGAGMEKQAMQQASMTEFSIKEGYLGFVVQYQGKTEKVPRIRPESSLEYQLTRAINKLAAINAPVIGVMAPQGNPMMGEQGRYNLIPQLLGEEGYEVKQVDVSSLADITTYAMMMVFDPDELSEEALYRLDQYVMGGGKLFVAASGAKFNPARGGLRATAKAPNVNSILDYYGVRINPNLIQDFANGVRQQMMTQRGFGVLTNPFQILVNGLNRENAITKSLTGMALLYPSSVSRSERGTSGTIENLIETSERSRLDETMMVLDPMRLRRPEPNEAMTTQVVAVQISGLLRSRFAEVDPPALSRPDGTTYTVQASQVKTQSNGKGAVVVAGTSLSFIDEAISQGTPVNAIFVLNVADSLTRGGSIIALRTKDLSYPQLKKPLTEAEVLRTQLLVMMGVPVLLIGLGVARSQWLAARRRRNIAKYGTPRAASAARS